MNKNIFVVYPSGKLGDFIWHLPFFKHISEKMESKIFLITRKGTSAKDLVKEENYIQKVFYVDFKKNIFFYFKDIFYMISVLKKYKANEVWILDKNSRPAIAAFFAGVNKRYGYGTGNQKIWINNKNKLENEDLKIHYIERAKKFFELQNIPIQYDFIKININDFESKKFKYLNNNSKKIIAYGVDSSEMYRSWPTEYFSKLIDLIDQNYNFTHILIAGPWNSHIADEIIEKSKCKEIHNFSHLKVLEVAALLKIADFFIGNDSGIMNLSAGVGTKTLGLYGATKSHNYSKTIIPVISKEGQIVSNESDRPLDDKGKTIKDPNFAKRVKPQDVFNVLVREIKHN